MFEATMEERALQGWGEAALSLMMGFEVWVPAPAMAAEAAERKNGASPAERAVLSLAGESAALSSGAPPRR